MPLGIFYVAPAARAQAVRGPGAWAGVVVVLATILGTAVVPAIARAFGLIDWFSMGIAVLGGAGATGFLTAALSPKTMEIVDKGRRERAMARRRGAR